MVQANCVREFRERMKLSKQKLSHITGISPSNLFHIETGRLYPYPGWRKRISEALGVSEDVIFPEIMNEEKD